MAPTIRYTGIPTSLWAEGSWFIERSSKAQLLYLQLWTSDDRDAAGFVPLQPDAWAERSTTATSETVKVALAELVGHGDVLTDERAGKAWLRRFVEDDAFSSPNVYVGAMNRIRSCPSRALRIAAWLEIQRLGLPIPKSEKTRDKMIARMEAAYGALGEQMAVDGEQVSVAAGATPTPAPPSTKTSTPGGFEGIPEHFGNGSERVSGTTSEHRPNGVRRRADNRFGKCSHCLQPLLWSEKDAGICVECEESLSRGKTPGSKW
jgi:hypothetical protein